MKEIKLYKKLKVLKTFDFYTCDVPKGDLSKIDLIEEGEILTFNKLFNAEKTNNLYSLLWDYGGIEFKLEDIELLIQRNLVEEINESI